jgi:hypothetical protein
MAVVALHASRRSIFISAATPNPVPSGAGRLMTCESLDGAQRFADQAAINTLVTAHGGNTADWVAMTLP